MSKKVTKYKQNRPNRWYEEYISPITGEKVLVEGNVIEQIIKDLYQYPKNNPLGTITKFVQERGIPMTTFVSWLAKFPRLKEAHDEALIAIGDQRETLALEGKINVMLAYKSLPHYLERWRQTEEWRAKLTSKEQPQDCKVVVVTQAIPHCPIVPDRQNTQSQD